ncbi:MAG: type IV pilin N-terminal domain-containing protein, partial [Halobacteriales archaeon]|nr:type IV pilin N-terminal domain-containing protein [Halobacteriales archaeon]
MDLTQLKQLFTDEDAVSPVIGVILMVAITVILAAVIGTFVLGLGENVQDSAPQANFQFDYNQTATAVTITHTGGEDVDASNVDVTQSTTALGTGGTPFSGTISTGSSGTYEGT